MKKSRLQKKAGFFGAGNVTRTRDLLITNQLLYQLSYTSNTPESTVEEHYNQKLWFRQEKRKEVRGNLQKCIDKF